MFLRTLGGLSLLDGGKELPVQRARIAILIVVAEAGPTGIARERLASLLWPDSDESKARNSLNQGLHALRQAAAPRELISGSSVLRLNTEICEADFVAFFRAVEEGDYAAALGRYAGPFLDGIHFRYGANFEQWTENVRARIESAHTSTLRAVGKRNLEAGDLERLVNVKRTVAAKDPLDPVAAAELVTALLLIGERSAAMRHVEIYEQLAMSELGNADPQVRRALAKGSPRHMPESLDPPGALNSLNVASAPETLRTHTPTSSAETHDLFPQTIAQPRSVGVLSRWGIPVGGIVAALIGGSAIFAASRREANPPQVAIPETVAVFPPCVTGDTALVSIAGNLQELLITSLASLHGPTPIKQTRFGVSDGSRDGSCTTAQTDSVSASSNPAPFAVYTRVAGENARVMFTAQVRDLHSKKLDPNQAFVESGPLDSVSTIVGRLANSIGAALLNEPSYHFADLASRPVSAVRFYLAGRAALRANRKEDAVAAFWRALDADSTFALAVLGLAESGTWGGGNSLMDRRRKGVTTTLSLRAKLQPRDRALFDAIVGPSDHRRSSLEQLQAWERVTYVNNDSPLAWYELGDALFHTGDALGLAKARVRAKVAFQSAVALDSSYAGPLAHLLEIAIDEKDASDVDKYSRLYFRADPNGEINQFLQWRIAVFHRDSRAIDTIRRALPEMPGAALRRIAGYSDLLPADHTTGMMAIEALNHRFSSLQEQFDALARLHDMALNGDDFTRVNESLDALRKMEPIQDGYLRDVVDADALIVTDALFANRPIAPTVISRMRQTAMSSSLRTGRDAVQYIGDNCAVGIWEARAGSAARAREAATRLAHPPINADTARAHSADGGLCRTMIQATLDVKAGNKKPTSLTELDRLAAQWTMSFGAGFANLLTAELFKEVGDRESALRAVRRRRYDWTEAIRYLASSRALERELLAAAH